MNSCFSAVPGRTYSDVKAESQLRHFALHFSKTAALGGGTIASSFLFSSTGKPNLLTWFRSLSISSTKSPRRYFFKPALRNHFWHLVSGLHVHKQKWPQWGSAREISQRGVHGLCVEARVLVPGLGEPAAAPRSPWAGSPGLDGGSHHPGRQQLPRHRLPEPRSTSPS